MTTGADGDESNPDLDSVKMRQVVKMTARSFYSEMVDYGFGDGDIISFTSDILGLLIKNHKLPGPPKPASISYPIDYKCDDQKQMRNGRDHHRRRRGAGKPALARVCLRP